jgi:hypothetical protein
MTKVRRARWRSDQFLDLAFNVAIGMIVAAILAGVWILMHRTGMTAVSNDLLDLFSTGFVALAHRVGPALPLYGAATAVLAGALGIWWWAERGGATL